jgi:hypothetical protein
MVSPHHGLAMVVECEKYHTAKIPECTTKVYKPMVFPRIVGFLAGGGV